MPFFAIALCWDNIKLKAAELFCIVQGGSILLPGHCILQIFCLSTINCKHEEHNAGSTVLMHSFAEFQDHLIFWSNLHLCRKNKEQSCQPCCSAASTSWAMGCQNLWSSTALFRAKLMVRIWTRFQWIIEIFNTSFLPPLQYIMLKLRNAFFADAVFNPLC